MPSCMETFNPNPTGLFDPLFLLEGGGVNLTPFPSDLGRWSGDRRKILPEHRAGCTLQEYMVKVFKIIDFICLINELLELVHEIMILPITFKKRPKDC